MRAGPDDGRETQRRGGDTRMSIAPLPEPALVLRVVQRGEETRVRAQRGILGDRDRVVGPRAVDRRARDLHDPSRADGRGGFEHLAGPLHVDVREQRTVVPPGVDAREMDDRLDPVEHGGEVARGDVDAVELEAPHPARRLVHVEADHPLDSVHRVEVREQPLPENPGDAGHRDRRREHVHRLIG